jgi:hypothetical protein
MVRWAAAAALRGCTDPQLLSPIIPLLQDEDLTVQISAAAALRGCTDPQLLSQIIPLLQDEDPMVQCTVVNALQRCTYPQLLSQIIPLLQDEDSEVRKAAAWALEKIAENFSYPEFYQAYHWQQTTSTSQRLNFADLRNLLEKAINEANLQDQFKVICIDGNQFSDPENPSLDIYDAMLEANCQELTEDPDTFSKLKRYWNSLRRDSSLPTPILIFYQDPTHPRPQDFSDAFLNQMSRFQGYICIISQHPELPLKTFSPDQPNLVENIIAWLQRELSQS